MRLMHTSDWHLGRKLKGIDRTPEIAAALNELLLKAQDLAVDAILIAGDIFDAPSPTAEAEQVAYNFFCQLQAAKIPAVAIAGNHDSAARLEGVAKLLSYIGVQVLGRPKKASEGGIINLSTANGKLCVAAMPFASERRLLKAEDLWNKDELEQRQHYKQLIAYLLESLAKSFQDDTINILMAHLTIDSARRTYSEVDYYTRDTYSLSGQTLPSQAQYIALGHIHKPQQIPNAAPTYYSGSLIQVDFGEAGEEKGFNLIDVEPGCPAKVSFHPLTCQKPLKVLHCQQSNLTEILEAEQDYQGFLKVIVELNVPKVGLADSIRKICPQALIIEPRYPEVTVKSRSENIESSQFEPVVEFKRYWSDRQGKTAPAPVIQAFEKLYQELTDATN
jgi:exonuclease SbcD